MATIANKRKPASGSVPVSQLGPQWGSLTRRNCFLTLSAIRELVPQMGDVQFSAGGRVSLDALAASAGLTRGAVLKSLRVWRTWRVLWLHWQGEEIELRFDRRVVVGLLTAERVVPGEVGVLMARHRERREAVAPRVPRESGVARKAAAPASLGLA